MRTMLNSLKRRFTRERLKAQLNSTVDWLSDNGEFLLRMFPI